MQNNALSNPKWLRQRLNKISPELREQLEASAEITGLSPELELKEWIMQAANFWGACDKMNRKKARNP